MRMVIILCILLSAGGCSWNSPNGDVVVLSQKKGGEIVYIRADTLHCISLLYKGNIVMQCVPVTNKAKEK